MLRQSILSSGGLHVSVSSGAFPYTVLNHLLRQYNLLGVYLAPGTHGLHFSILADAWLQKPMDNKYIEVRGHGMLNIHTPSDPYYLWDGATEGVHEKRHVDA
jgi:hypothetical protein